jgi:hypothetical protein
MKEKVIETAGLAWQLLGKNGETEVGQIAKKLKVRDDLALQAIGWLAREDKINYSSKSRKTFVSLVETELQAFQGFISSAVPEQGEGTPTTKRRRNFRSLKTII